MIRDLSLGTEEGSPKIYMEKALIEKNGISDSIEKINRTKRLIKNLFQNRDCVTLSKPCSDLGTLTD